MPSDQTEIYCLFAPNREAAESSPYFEAFRARKFEVLFFHDPWDEFVVDHLRNFESKPLRAAEKADVTAGDLAASGEALSEDEGRALAEWLKQTLGDRVNQVRVSKRLVDSPAIVVDSDSQLTSTMRRILKAAGKPGEKGDSYKPDLEVNSRHAILVRLNRMRQDDETLAREVAEQLFDNARVAAGLLEDPRTMLKRLNDLLARVLEKKS
jgi:molecular chaperone HtpG